MSLQPATVEDIAVQYSNMIAILLTLVDRNEGQINISYADGAIALAKEEATLNIHIDENQNLIITRRYSPDLLPGVTYIGAPYATQDEIADTP